MNNQEQTNRPIKFRAWNRKEEMMLTVDAIVWSEGYIWHPEAYDVIEDVVEYTEITQPCRASLISDCVLMQFTGFKTNDGLEVYEGDIIGPQYPKEIVFSEYRGAFCGVPLSERNVKWMDPRQTLTQKWFNEFAVTVIGNIYEHPHLLSEKTT